jgi:hypothetical protein
MNATIPTAAFDMWIGEFTGLTDYDMSDYLKYRGEKNYFHHQDGYTDLAFADIEAATDEYDRAYAVKTMLKSVMEGNFCRPLCEEVSSVYVTNTSMVSWKEDMCLNEYDSFAEVVCNIEVN